MTPAEYFAKHPTACEPAQDFCARFPTMREAWMSPDVDVAYMLWALGREEANRPGIVEFAKWCAASAAAAWSAAFAASAAAAWSAAFAASASAAASAVVASAAASAVVAADAAAYAAAQQAQREQLRKLFPNQFA